MQAFAIAGATHMGDLNLNTSQLDRVIGLIRTSVKKGWRSIIDTLNQPGNPL